MVPGGQGVKGVKVQATGSQEVKGKAFRVPGGQGVRPTGSQGVKG